MKKIIGQNKEAAEKDLDFIDFGLVSEELNLVNILSLEEVEEVLEENTEVFQALAEDWVALENLPAAAGFQYRTQLADNASANIASDAATDETGAEKIPDEGKTGSGKMPWLLGGGLLLAGLGAAAAGGGGSSSDDNETPSNTDTAQSAGTPTTAESTPAQTSGTAAGTPASGAAETTASGGTKVAETDATDEANKAANTKPETTTTAGTTPVTTTTDTTPPATTTNTTPPATTTDTTPPATTTDTTPPATTTDTTPPATTTDTTPPATTTDTTPPATTTDTTPPATTTDTTPPATTTDTTPPATTTNTTPPATTTDTTPPATTTDTTPPATTTNTTPPATTTDTTPPATTTDTTPPATTTGTTTPETTTAGAAGGKESGLTLDIAKHFYSADVIKKYIDTISKSGGTFLQLHLSDDDNYAFESAVLNQLVENATLNADGTYTNPLTGKQFLSTEQVADIAAYAKTKGVEIIPEVDTPNHMDAIFTLLENYKGADYVNSIKSQTVDDEINITSTTAISFVQSLYSEVIGMMGGSSKHFHIGGDEFGYSASNNHEFITYANTMSTFLEGKGLTTRMWNDGLLKTSLASLDKDIEVTYWSYDGNPGDTATANERRETRASMEDLTDQGFDVLNYNWYYLYFVPDDGVTNAESGAHMASDIQAKWNLNTWDGLNTANAVKDTGKVIGSSLTIWGEYADNMTDDAIYNYSADGLAALISKTNAASVDKTKLSSVAVAIDDTTEDNKLVSLDSAKSEMAKVSLSDTMTKTYSFVWMKGDTDDMVTLSSDWSYSGASALKDDVSYSLYKTGNHHLYIDTDMAVEVV